MAELLGTIASAIAVAEVGLKLGGTVLKLKGLWNEIQEVPDTISDLMDEIEILGQLVEDFDAQDFAMASTSGDRSAKLSVSYFQAALRHLGTLAENLRQEVESKKKRKRFSGRVKVVLSQETIAKTEAKMQRALALLQAAQTSYLM